MTQVDASMQSREGAVVIIYHTGRTKNLCDVNKMWPLALVYLGILRTSFANSQALLVQFKIFPLKKIPPPAKFLIESLKVGNFSFF